MGNSASSQAFIRNDSLTSIVNDFVTNNIIEDNLSATNINVLKLQYGYAENCPIEVNQDIKSTVQVKTQIDSQAVSDLQTQIEQNLSATLTQQAEMVNGFAAVTGGNEVDTVANIKNTINTTVKNTVTVQNIQRIATTSYNVNDGQLTVEFCKGSPLKWNQSIVSNVISENIIHSVSTQLLKNKQIQSLVAYVDQKASQKNQGLNDLVDSIGKALSSVIGAFTGPLAAVWIGGLILCCVCCVALLYFMMSPAGQKAATNISGAGANIARSRFG